MNTPHATSVDLGAFAVCREILGVLPRFAVTLRHLVAKDVLCDVGRGEEASPAGVAGERRESLA
ncbi:MAG: hypothetical protein NT069_04315 [Planctomycetota bacterium]|nr:hypothetical protein [Planctomycetota bacterium]